MSLARRGARVLALGYRKLSSSTTLADLRNYTREDLESQLEFAGFVIISCPLKADSKSVIKEIINASHSVIDSSIYLILIKIIEKNNNQT